jgi:hypothetical protein
MPVRRRPFRCLLAAVRRDGPGLELVDADRSSSSGLTAIRQPRLQSPEARVPRPEVEHEGDSFGWFWSW